MVDLRQALGYTSPLPTCERTPLVQSRGRAILLTGLLVLACGSALAQREVALRMWTEVKGTTPGEEMGFTVTAIPPNLNLPYRANALKNSV